MWPRRETFFYVLHVFLPFLPLVLAFPKRYLLIPLPLMTFYASFPDTLFMVMWPNYAFPLAFLCSAGLILSPTVRFHTAGVVGDAGNFRSLDGRILAACAVTSLLCYPLWREIFSVPSGNPARVGTVDRIRACIPEDAKVVVNGSFTARFSARKEVSVWGWRTRELGYFDYAVVDARFKPNWLVDEKDLAAGLDTLFHSPHWKLESAEDSLFLFRREVPRLGIARFHR